MFSAIVAGGAVAGISIAAFGGVIVNAVGAIVNGSPNEIIARVKTEAGDTYAIRRRHLAETRLVTGTDAPLALDLRYKGGEARVEGREARCALRAGSCRTSTVSAANRPL